MDKKQNYKELTLECSDHDPLCGKLLVIRFGSLGIEKEMFEICWLKPRQKKPKIGIVLEGKSLAKFRKFIEVDN